MNYSFNLAPIWGSLDDLIFGLLLALQLSASAIAIGIMIGLAVAFLRVSDSKVSRRVGSMYVVAFRNTPLLVIIFIIFFGLPQLGVRFSRNPSFVLALSLYSASYFAEVFRGGLLAVPRGIKEAGQAIGLMPIQVLAYIVLPVMLRMVLPSLSNTMISVFKDTSLAAAIAVPELTYQARKINVETFRVIESWLAASLLYVGATYAIAGVLRFIERRLALPK